MQRQVETANAARAKRDRERMERERHWVIDHDTSSSSSDAARSGSSSSATHSAAAAAAATTARFVVIRDDEATSLGPKCTLSRRSFRGFNENVERHHVGIRREREAMERLDDVEEDALDDEEMAEVLGGGRRSGGGGGGGGGGGDGNGSGRRSRVRHGDVEEEGEGAHRKSFKRRGEELQRKRSSKQGRRSFG